MTIAGLLCSIGSGSKRGSVFVPVPDDMVDERYGSCTEMLVLATSDTCNLSSCARH